jgi:Arc/MetJ-type ribon-helix-helix transcriptional regulator
VALVHKLQALAAESSDDLAARYTMLDEAHKLAVQAGDLSLALTAIDQLARRFAIDKERLQVVAVAKCEDAAKTTADRRRVAERALELLDELIVAGRFDAASDVVQAAISASTRAKDADLGKSAREFRDEITQAKRKWHEVQEAQKKLAEDSRNEELQLQVGRFLCFHQRNFSEGLPHLVLGGSPGLAAAARLDLANPTQPEEQVAVGRAWSELLKPNQNQNQKPVETAERPAVALRALHWLRQAEPQLKGLAKADVEQQLKELESSLPSRVRTASKPAKPAEPVGFQPPREFIGALGRIQVNGVDAGVLWKYEAGLRLTNLSVTDVLQQAGVPRGRLRMEFAAFFHVHESMTVNISQAGGSPTGTATLLVDNKPVGEVGGPRATTDVYKVELMAGEHTLRWILSGDDLGACSLGLTNSETAQPLPLYHTPVLLNLVRENPTRARLNVNMARN